MFLQLIFLIFILIMDHGTNISSIRAALEISFRERWLKLVPLVSNVKLKWPFCLK